MILENNIKILLESVSSKNIQKLRESRELWVSMRPEGNTAILARHKYNEEKRQIHIKEGNLYLDMETFCVLVEMYMPNNPILWSFLANEL